MFQICCLSRIPLFGYIEVKLSLFVNKIFEQADFNNSEELLKEAYIELNRCLSMRIETIDPNDFFIGICLRELFSIWKHKVLVLFKSLLLEKRILFYGSPVKPLCTTILSIISLHPQLLNKGLCNFLEENCHKSEVMENPIQNGEIFPACEHMDMTDTFKQQPIKLECNNYFFTQILNILKQFFPFLNRLKS